MGVAPSLRDLLYAFIRAAAMRRLAIGWGLARRVTLRGFHVGQARPTLRASCTDETREWIPAEVGARRDSRTSGSTSLLL